MGDEQLSDKQKVANIISAYVADIERRQKLPPDPADKGKRFLPFRVTEMHPRTIRKDLEVILEGAEKPFLDQVAAEVRMHQAISAAIVDYNPDIRPMQQLSDRKIVAEQEKLVLKAEQVREYALMPLDKIITKNSNERIKTNNQGPEAAAHAYEALKETVAGVRKDARDGVNPLMITGNALNFLGAARLQLSDENGAGAEIVAYNVVRDAINFAGREAYKEQLKAKKPAAAEKPATMAAPKPAGSKGSAALPFPVDNSALMTMERFAQSLSPATENTSLLNAPVIKTKVERGAA